MTLVVLQPAGSAESQKHYQDTVLQPVPIRGLNALTHTERLELEGVFTDGRARFWGATPGASGVNIGKHDRLHAGDIVLFAAQGRLFSTARIVYVMRNESLAESLWGRDENSRTWELMFAIDDVRMIDVSVVDVNHAVGYQPNNNIQGFTVLSQGKSEALIEALGLTGNAIPGSSATGVDEDNLRQFSPKDSSDYTSTIVGRTLVKSRSHEALVRDFGLALIDLGYSAVTNCHPRDLTLSKGDSQWLVEVKVVRNGDVCHAVREVVGQLLEYRHFWYARESNPLLVGVFSAPIGDAFVDYLESLSIRSVWQAADSWGGSDSAVLDGIVPS